MWTISIVKVLLVIGFPKREEVLVSMIGNRKFDSQKMIGLRGKL
jgi:hypothetical protein